MAALNSLQEPGPAAPEHSAILHSSAVEITPVAYNARWTQLGHVYAKRSWRAWQSMHTSQGNGLFVDK
jgi:hypothetical protein